MITLIGIGIALLLLLALCLCVGSDDKLPRGFDGKVLTGLKRRK